MNYKKKEYNSNTLRDYATDFIKYDTICAQAPMGFGKTKQLIELLDKKEYKNKKIIIVSFRRSLLRQYKNNLPGFKYYTDIKDRKIDLDVNRNLIIQADSLYRIRGEVDLLVLDECTYTLDHAVTYIKKFKPQCVSAIEHLLSTSGKVLAIDALFTDDYVDIISSYRNNTIYTINTNQFHKNKSVTMYGNDFQLFYNRMIESLRKKEKIVICTNSKIKLNYFEDRIKKEFENIKCLFIDGDHEVDYKVEDWKSMDVVGYTPTITAGVSFEAKNFDRCFGYFISGSSSAALSIQQLFRVRNFNKNQFNICVDVTAPSNYPVNFEDLDNFIENRHTSLIDGNEILEIDYGKKNVHKDSYYYMYRTVMKYINLSKNNYQGELIRILKTQGITDIKNTGKKDNTLNRILRNDYRTFKELKEEQNAISISESDSIDSETYHELCNKENIKRKDRNAMLKYSFLDQTKISEDKLTPKIYQEYKPKLAQFHNLSFIKSNKNDFKEKINKRLAYNDLRKGDKSIDILHQSKKYEKIKILDDTVRDLGWKDLNDNQSIDLRLDYGKIIPLLKKMECIFDTSIHTWDIKHKNTRTSIIRYINSRLKSTLDINMSYDKISKKYTLTTISSWEFMYENFDTIKENLDQKEIDFENKLFIETWVYKLINDLPPNLNNNEIEQESEKESELSYVKPDHMDYINMFKEKNKKINKKNKSKPNRRVNVYKDSHKNKHKGPAFMIEEIEKWDKNGTIFENMGGVYEGHDILWTDPEYQPNISGKKACEKLFELFGIKDGATSTEQIHTLNGYTKNDILEVGRDQILWGGNKDLYESDSEEEPEYDLY